MRTLPASDETQSKPRRPARARRHRLLRTLVVLVTLALIPSLLVLRARFAHTSTPASARIVVPRADVRVLPLPTPTPPTVQSASSTFFVAPGSSDVSGPGALRRFSVEVEVGLDVDVARFTQEIERVLRDRRGWGASGRVGFQRVPSGGSFRITLASPQTTRRLCRPLDTGRTLSCYQRGRAVLNVFRWLNGSPFFPDLAAYRAYMINHEVGHAIGHDHAHCPRSGRLAPVMMQQTKGLAGCRPNAWPLPAEL